MYRVRVVTAFLVDKLTEQEYFLYAVPNGCYNWSRRLSPCDKLRIKPVHILKLLHILLASRIFIAPISYNMSATGQFYSTLFILQIGQRCMALWPLYRIYRCRSLYVSHTILSFISFTVLMFYQKLIDSKTYRTSFLLLIWSSRVDVEINWKFNLV